MVGLWGIKPLLGKNKFTSSGAVFLYFKCSFLFKKVQSLCLSVNNHPARAFLKRLTYGALQSMMKECGIFSKALEDVVGSVRGNIRVQ